VDVYIENVGSLAVIECEGRIVQSDAVLKLRDAVTSQTEARFVVIDLSEVRAIEAGGVGMLIFLKWWTQHHGIRFKLFNPSSVVRNKLEYVNSMSEFDIASLDEMMALLAHEDSRYALAA
jgi:anti-anti-sigma regulatory factor